MHLRLSSQQVLLITSWNRHPRSHERAPMRTAAGSLLAYDRLTAVCLVRVLEGGARKELVQGTRDVLENIASGVNGLFLFFLLLPVLAHARTRQSCDANARFHRVFF